MCALRTIEEWFIEGIGVEQNVEEGVTYILDLGGTALSLIITGKRNEEGVKI